ncbi:MAG: MBL fold metallo-hydrolase [Bacteroidia bacterium]|nr:MBL fold metallo-hydrolase [Bacteroidia bacterium]
MLFKQFGGKITSELLAYYQKSKYWNGTGFQNLEYIDQGAIALKMPAIIYKQLTNKRGREPKFPLPVQPFDYAAFMKPSSETKLIWYGHSAVLLRMNNMTILIDPMLGPDTTPIAPTTTKRFSKNTLDIIDDFPEIDLMLLTHDHYDHLDYTSIQKLKLKTKQYFVAMGVKRHLMSWGIAGDSITEFDWWKQEDFEGIEITFTPTRHFSGRGLRDRMKSFWGGWALKTSTENIWFSGDGGYGSHFKTIGERLGPFDFALMECGQYNDDWPTVHLFPNDSIQAARDARVQKVMPVHWAGFHLSYHHTWKEPAEDFVKAAIENELTYALPRLGQLFMPSSDLTEKWWNDFE